MDKREQGIAIGLAVFAFASGSAAAKAQVLWPHHEVVFFWVAVALSIASLIGVAAIFLFPGKVANMADKLGKIGKHNVLMGAHSFGEIGDGNVIIGGDANGNVILNKPMTVGYGAQGGPDSIVIGAFAGAGTKPKDTTDT